MSERNTDNAFVSRFKCYSVAVVRFITKFGVQARGAKGYRILRRRMRREGEGPGFPCKASILGDGEARPPKLEVERTLHVIWMTRKFLLLLDVHLCICYCDGMLQLPFYPSLKPVYYIKLGQSGPGYPLALRLGSSNSLRRIDVTVSLTCLFHSSIV